MDAQREINKYEKCEECKFGTEVGSTGTFTCENNDTAKCFLSKSPHECRSLGWKNDGSKTYPGKVVEGKSKRKDNVLAPSRKFIYTRVRESNLKDVGCASARTKTECERARSKLGYTRWILLNRGNSGDQYAWIKEFKELGKGIAVINHPPRSRREKRLWHRCRSVWVQRSRGYRRRASQQMRGKMQRNT